MRAGLAMANALRLRPPAAGAALDAADQGVERAGEDQHEHDAEIDLGRAEHRAVLRDQEADAVGRRQHLRHHDADRGQRAADAQAGDDGRQRGGDDDLDRHLAPARSVRPGHQHETAIHELDARRGGEHDGEEAVEPGEPHLARRTDAEPGGQHRIDHDEGYRVDRGEQRQQDGTQQRRRPDGEAHEATQAVGDEERDGDLAQREGERAREGAEIGDAGQQRRAGGREDHRRHPSQPRRRLPQQDQKAKDQPAQGDRTQEHAGPRRRTARGAAHGVVRISRQIRSRNSPKAALAITSQVRGRGRSMAMRSRTRPGRALSTTTSSQR